MGFNVHIMGRCPKLYFIFWLDPKNEAKKVKTSSGEPENKRDRLKSSKLLPSVVRQGRFLIACLSYFPAHRTRSRLAGFSVIVILDFPK